MKRFFLAALLLSAFSAAVADPQTTAFTYQGYLTANGAPANGNFDLTFKLFDAAAAGNQIGPPIVMSAFPVVNGRFTTDVDFPTAFVGEQRWVEVTVGAQVLSPRQPVNSVPAAQAALRCCSPYTVVVNAGADAQLNGTNLIAALAATAAQSPTASKVFVVKLEPGVYDVGSTSLQLLPFVQMEGAGEGATQITGAGQDFATSGVILAANNTQLRNLTVQSQSGKAFSTGIYADGTITSTFLIRHVSVQIAGGSSNGTGIYNNGGSPIVENSTVIVSNVTANGLGYGISNNSSAAQIKYTTIQVQSTGTGQVAGIYNSNGTTSLINNVQINASTSGAPANALSPDAVGISNLTASPTIQNANIASTTTGGGSAVGIVLNNSSTNTTNTLIENSDIVANSSGASFIQGILNNTAGNNPAAVIVRNSSISANGTNRTNCQAFGVDSFGAPTVVYNSNVSASVGTGCLAGVGLILQGAPNDLTFNNGYVKSTQYAMYNNNGIAKIKVGASQLSAPTTVSGSGQAVCINTFKSDYTTTTATCS